MTTFTVITCTYNAAATVERTLASVMEQDCRDVEHIIIDGCSQDETVNLAQTYKQESDKRGTGHKVKIISERDNGLYDAMNKGISLAGGEYIVYINAGDTFPDRHTLSSVAALAESPAVLPGVIYGDTDIVDNDGNFVRHRRLHPGENLSWRDYRRGMLVCHQAFYALTSIAKHTPYNLEYRYSADVDWCIRVLKAAEREGRETVYARRVVANYLSGGMTTSNHRASLAERFRVMRRHYGWVVTVANHIWFVVRAVIRR
ncbi:MAG: glycosyltransferase [Prevotella sp.]|nr:glycosyltransferase [Prevotella sp.]